MTEVIKMHVRETIQTGGGGGSASWGNITGTLANQTDLKTALDAKLNASAINDTTPASDKVYSSEKVDPVIQKVDVQNITNDNLLNIADADFTVDGLTITIRNNIITVNGTRTTQSNNNFIYVKVTGTPDVFLKWDSSIQFPPEWLAEEVDFLEVGKRYAIQGFVLEGTTTASGIVPGVRDGSNNTLFAPSNGVVTIDHKGAYARLYLAGGNGSVFNNFKYGIMITENYQATSWSGGASETIIAYKDFYAKYIKTINWSNLAFSHPTITGQANQYTQGMCMDGEYLYTCIIDGTDAHDTYVAKISPSDGSVVADTKTYSLGHCNSMTYCEADGYIHCVALDNIGTVHRITTALAYVDSYTVDISAMYSDYTGIRELYYNPDREMFVGVIRGDIRGFILLDKNRVISDIIWCKDVTGTWGSLYADADFLYQPIYNPNKLAVYAWNGKLIDLYELIGLTGEPEQIAVFGDNVYMSRNILSGDDKGAYIAKGTVSFRKYGMLLKI